ncbi:MAG: alpha-L-arabinofuranosidase C-terminal domain-containing protein [bacterium]|nr:alpha-L-arabinofuranosidase C-terminal domain-containing protein [bacterium]
MAKLCIDGKKTEGHINPEIYGQFAEHLGRGIYEGIYVGEDSEIPNTNGMRNDVVAALKEMKVPVLRWPGGCFADEYHWKDGIGPKQNRKRIVNVNWGNTVEDNSFGTHEFFELCKQLGCKTYINGNVGSGTVQEMEEWIDYMTFKGESPMANLRRENGHEDTWSVDYFGVGNENWGCGGNMTPQYYANLYRRYQTFVRDYDNEKPIAKICCGANSDDYEWTEEVMKTCHYKAPEHLHGFMDGLSLHYYTIPRGDWTNKGSATKFDKDEYYTTLYKTKYMEELIRKHTNIMSKYADPKDVGLIVDEWGCWYDVEPGTNPGFLYQQNTMRDAMVAAINFDIFNHNCNVVRMANIAQMVNVLASSILTEGEAMILTPTYYAFHMYRFHQDAELVHTYLTENSLVGTKEGEQIEKITQTVSKGSDGILNITMSNLSVDSEETVDVMISGVENIKVLEASSLNGKMDACNTFEQTDAVQEMEFTEYSLEGNMIKVVLPPCSIVLLRVSE